MNKRSEGSSFGTMLNCGVGEGRLLKGGAGIGEGGSISSGVLSISLLRLHEPLVLG